MIMIFISLVTCTSLAAETKLTIPTLIKQAEARNHLPDGILAALIQVESNGNPRRFVKEDGKPKHASHGLTQIQASAAKFVGFNGKEKQLMDPSINIEYGARYLRYMITLKKGNVAAALSCYNLGSHSEICKKNQYYAVYVGKVLNAWSNAK